MREPERDNPDPDDPAARLFLDADEETWLERCRIARLGPPPARLGGYELLGDAGRGAQGSVYKAVQPGTGRVVAIKRLEAGRFATARMLARFELEIVVLATLNHPNIVTVFGADEVDGQRILLMEWIDGVPADDWAASRDVRERLRVFALACDAVNHAHQRGVIHRDLKPSNILVDAAGAPHVLDFGLARLVQAAPGPELSASETFVGTPAYAAPEQVGGRPEDIDTRTDVYALGAVLYEMLTGAPPLKRRADLVAMIEAIRTQEPRPPSALNPELGSELDAIALKALSKEPWRRYQSVAELGEDVRRFLAGEAVLAHPPSRAYRARKFVRRHRAGVATAATGVLLFVAGTAAIAMQAVRATRAEALAERRAEQTGRVAAFHAELLRDVDLAAMGRGLKESFRDQVRAALAHEWIGEFPQRRARTPEEIEAELAAFDLLAGAAQGADVARHILDEYVLRPAAAALDERFDDEPLVRARVQNAIGRMYRSLGMYDAAETHLRSSLESFRAVVGPGHPDAAACLDNLASVLKDKGDYSAAETLAREALKARRLLLAGDSPEVADSLNNLGGLLYLRRSLEEAEALYREALEMRRRLYRGESPLVAQSMTNLGGVLHLKGDHAGAELLFVEALAMRRRLLGEHHIDVAHTLGHLVALMTTRRDYAAAEPLARKAMAIERAVLGNDHPGIAATLNNLAGLLFFLGDYAAALPLCQEALALRRRHFGDAHKDVATSVRNVAKTFWAMGEAEQAEPLLREALALRSTLLPRQHPDRIQSLVDLGDLLLQRGDTAAAEALFREALEAAEAHLAHSDRLVLLSRAGLAAAWIDMERFVQAEQLLLAADDEGPAAVRTYVKLYEAWHDAQPGNGHDKQAAAWRARLPEADGR